MSEVAIERAVYRRERDEEPRLLARTPGIGDDLFAPMAELLVAFGQRPAGIACPGAIFARPLGAAHVAVVHVRDAAPGPDGWASLQYSIDVLTSRDYDLLGGDPFALSARIPAIAPNIVPAHLDRVTLPAQPLTQRGVEQVRAVLKRIKANALPEGVDPDKLPPLTVDNAESPTLLGGVQVLVDGGKLVFERSRPDADLIQGLWTLLPHRLRPKLWPASFAFNNDLGFDVVVVPKIAAFDLAGYTTEDQAGDYVQGSYELALQTAAEAGDAHELEAVFQRRTSNETFRLAVRLLIGACLIVAAIRLFPGVAPIDPAPRAAAAAGIVGVRDPWMSLHLLHEGNRLYLKR